LKIAQIAPLYESVPPSQYGGTERVVSYLTEALTEMGHEVTLFATGDSVTSGHLVAVVPRGRQPAEPRKCPDSRDEDQDGPLRIYRQVRSCLQSLSAHAARTGCYRWARN
jgi:hypothetical protein